MSNKRPRRNNNGPMNGGPVNLSVEKPKHFKKSMGRLLGVLKPHRTAIVVVTFLTTAATIVSIISPRILGDMTNQIVDDFVAVKAYETVQENLPDNVKLPSGTKLKDLPDVLKNAAMSGQIDPATMAKLAEAEQSMSGDSLLDSMPASQRELVENLDLSEKPVFHFDKLAEIALFLIVLYLASLMLNYICGWIFSGIVMRTVKKMRQQLAAKINRLPISYFDKHQYGDTLSRVTNDVDTISQTLSQSASQVLSSIVLLVGVLAMMISINWLLTVVAVVVILISFGFVGLITRASQKHFVDLQNNLGDLTGHVEENYAGQIVVKAFSAEQRSGVKFANLNGKLYRSAWKSQFFSGLMMPIMDFVSKLGYVATAVLGGWLAVNGRLSIGDIQAFIQYVSQMQQPISQVGQIATLLQSTAAAAERVFDFLDETEETPEGEKTLPDSATGEVEFKNVSFGYLPNKKIIRNFSAHIRPGQKVAIVGPTGAGKTTLVNLLMRFYDPDNGEIQIDGVNTRDVKRADVRSMFGMVLQDTWLTSGTVYENLAYGDLTASREQIKAAAKAAHVDHFVRSLPYGYDTIIDEDSDNISVGEKQLLTIARAMLADAPMLILDEATSSVDTRTEVLIQKAMERLMKGRTSFVIAHRLSTIKNSDLILVMKDGNIIEQGNHRELIRKDGFYAKLYNSQFIDA